MTKGQYTVWVWYVDGVPVYAGWGKQTATSHPADRMYAKAQSGENPSPLSAWLESLEGRPPREEFGTWGKDDARLLANALRAKFRRKGHRLLSSKPFDRCVGGGMARPVVAPSGKVYGSVRVAAEYFDVNPSTILRWCSANVNGWSYQESCNEDHD